MNYTSPTRLPDYIICMSPTVSTWNFILLGTIRPPTFNHIITAELPPPMVGIKNKHWWLQSRGRSLRRHKTCQKRKNIIINTTHLPNRSNWWWHTHTHISGLNWERREGGKEQVEEAAKRTVQAVHEIVFSLLLHSVETFSFPTEIKDNMSSITRLVLMTVCFSFLCYYCFLFFLL